ncbi:MAG: hypothetical protein QOH12_1052 [Solirubrobacteraceae bacterium]|nr:hypothetical protein [Solirubrobacteraceae bacterium]
MELSQSSVDPALGGAQGDAEDPRDLRDGEVGPEAERQSLPLVLSQPRQGVLDLVSPVDRLDLVIGCARPGPRLGRHSLERPLLDLPAAGAVAQTVEGNRVEPGLLGRADRPRPGSRSRPQDLLESVREEILAQCRIAGPVREEPEQRLRVLLVQPLEVSVADSSNGIPVRNRPASSS